MKRVVARRSRRCLCLPLCDAAAAAETKLTIATVNNGDMIRMQG